MLGNLFARGKEYAKGGSLVWFALHFNPAAVLTDHAKHGGEPQTSAVARSLGGEEWFKDVAEDMRFHPDAVVLKSETDEIAFAALRVGRGRGAVDGCDRSSQ